ncbi:MAG: alpha/beta hydrolase [Rhodospirillaceae bacterium]|nr:alpha/beta hydrolase [Rhodospirillaceae bacterium]
MSDQSKTQAKSPPGGGEGYMAAAVDVDRAFVRIKEGLVHYRHAGQERAGEGKAGGPLPLYIVHAGPGSSAGMAPMIQEMGKTRRVIAPDTLGNGDSAGPGVANPDLAYYADSVVRVMDALKLDRVDYFGTHTGAHIGTELLIARPDRFRRVIFDGIGIFPPAMKAEMLANYAPAMQPDEFGRHLIWAWNFVRDQSLHFPYFKRTPEFKMNNPVPPAEFTHRSVVEVLKALTTFHNGYNAVFSHDTAARLKQLKISPADLMFMVSEPDPLNIYLDEAAALVPGARKKLLGRAEGLAGRIKAMHAFYDA